MANTTYHVRARVRSTGREIERYFGSSLERTLFIIGFEGNGLGTILEEWLGSSARNLQEIAVNPDPRD